MPFCHCCTYFTVVVLQPRCSVRCTSRGVLLAFYHLICFLQPQTTRDCTYYWMYYYFWIVTFLKKIPAWLSGRNSLCYPWYQCRGDSTYETCRQPRAPSRRAGATEAPRHPQRTASMTMSSPSRLCRMGSSFRELKCISASMTLISSNVQNWLGRVIAVA